MAEAEKIANEGQSAVIIDHEELEDDSLCDSISERIERGFGKNGLGLILVTNVPDLPKRREALLRSTYILGNLPDTILAKYENVESFYSVGWSRGKEMLAKDTPDFAKGSWYANPLFNKPTMNERLIRENAAPQKTPFYHPNIWPEEFPQIEDQFMSVGEMVVGVGTKLARHCDKYCSAQTTDYPDNELENICSLSLTHKARLLYYYPCDDEKVVGRPDSWCGWHNDHGALTGLLIGQFFNKKGECVPNPQPEAAGLFIKTRQGEIVKVSVQDPTTTLAFQIGETSQIQSGGLMMATPHAVMGTTEPGYSRATFAVFMEPDHLYDMTIPESRSVQEATFTDNLPENVPPLKNRWGNVRADKFNDFSNRTFKAYYTLKCGEEEATEGSAK